MQLVGDASSLNRAFGQAHASGSKFGKFAKVGIGAALAGVGAAAVGMGALLKVGFDEFKEAQKVTAQTNAVLKSTKGIANVTGVEVEKLGDRLSRLSGVDDEVIRSGSNMLLTFKNIRNEAGRNNDIFNQATAATLDLSVAMGTDMSKAAIMVGKALNDPIKGIGAMRRVGIQFTEAQEDQIKALVESGDTMKAQKIILKELESQFGGSAKAAGDTLGGQLNKLRNRFDELAAKVFQAVLPALTEILDIAVKLFPMVEKFGGQAVRLVADAFGQLAGKADALGVSLRDTLGAAWQWIQKNVVPIIQELRAIWVAAVTRIAATLKKHEPDLRRIWERVGAAVRALGQIALPIIRFVFVEVLPRAIAIAIRAVDKATAALAAIVRFIRGAFRASASVFRTVADVAQRAFAAIARAVRIATAPILTMINAVQRLINLINAIPNINRAIAGGGGGNGTPVGRGARPRSVNPNLDSATTPGFERTSSVGGGVVKVIVVGGNKQGIDWIQGLDRDYRRANGGRGLLAT